MNAKNKNSEILTGLLYVFQKQRQKDLMENPFKFITQVLGYEFENFHQKWWLFQQNNPRTIILAPRGHGKSTILTIAYSIWRLARNRDLRILIVSNTHMQAKAFLREIKNHLEANACIKECCGHMKGFPWTDTEISVAARKRVAKEASITAMGMCGPVISRHYDMIILDDVIDEENASSAIQRNKALTWYYKELMPTLEPDGKIHILGTRYHYLDLYGSLIQGEFKDNTIVSRAIFSENGKPKALWEKKFPLELLLKKRSEAGPVIFNSQYQNDVEAMKGAIFKQEWIGYCDNPPRKIKKYQAVDLAVSKTEYADYFAHVTIGQDENMRLYVLDAYRDRLSFDAQFKIIINLFDKHDSPDSPVIRVGVESNAYQEVMAQKLRKETRLPVKSVFRHKDKITRAYRLQAFFETGRILFPGRGAEDLIEELLLFPEAPHDDLFDALECAVSMANETGSYKDSIRPAPDISPA